MRKLIVLAVVVALAWQWQRLHTRGTSGAEEAQGPTTKGSANFLVAQTTEHKASFVCDGRVLCSQMTSCEEATYFLGHCLGTKMDGDRDGIPCEDQWCSTH